MVTKAFEARMMREARRNPDITEPRGKASPGLKCSLGRASLAVMHGTHAEGEALVDRTVDDRTVVGDADDVKQRDDEGLLVSVTVRLDVVEWETIVGASAVETSAGARPAAALSDRGAIVAAETAARAESHGEAELW